MPRVSIITAARIDSEAKQRWLRECAESVLTQSYQDWEMVIVDDASPLELDLSDDPRIRWKGFRAVEHSGPSVCRNTAVALSKGDALLPLDADDMLASPDVLEILMNAWENDPGRFYYGNIQIYQNGIPGNVVRFGQYPFEDSLKPKGVVPVTALHSADAWSDGGGWKPDLSYGLEDVEYWISLGKRGWCGQKLELTTILYRKHPTSRTAAMRSVGALREKDMIAVIRNLHDDVYNGRYPMGCCGGGRGAVAGTPLPIKQDAPRALPPRTESLGGDEVFVRYNGGRTGQFFVRGQMSGANYEIRGTGDVFPIHAQDAYHFRGLGRGKDFSVGVPQPQPPPPPEPEPEASQEYKPEPPKVTTIVGDAPPPPVAEKVQPGTPSIVMVEVEQEQEEAEIEALKAGVGLEGLDVRDNIREMLEVEGWTVPSLAAAKVEELTPYPGIGPATAEKLIQGAKSLWAG